MHPKCCCVAAVGSRTGRFVRYGSCSSGDTVLVCARCSLAARYEAQAQYMHSTNCAWPAKFRNSACTIRVKRGLDKSRGESIFILIIMVQSSLKVEVELVNFWVTHLCRHFINRVGEEGLWNGNSSLSTPALQSYGWAVSAWVRGIASHSGSRGTARVMIIFWGGGALHTNMFRFLVTH